MKERLCCRERAEKIECTDPNNTCRANENERCTCFKRNHYALTLFLVYFHSLDLQSLATKKKSSLCTVQISSSFFTQLKCALNRKWHKCFHSAKVSVISLPGEILFLR